MAAKLERGSSPLVLALIAAAAFANDFIYLLFFTGLHLGRFFILLITVSIPSTVYTALIGIAVFKAAEALGSSGIPKRAIKLKQRQYFCKTVKTFIKSLA